jgi:hypothetical protein
MKPLFLSLAVVGIFFASVLAHANAGCPCKQKSKSESARAKTVRVQGHPISPQYGQAPITRPSAFGGDKGTLWKLAETVHNQ